ncbi:MAG: hypothetical protein SFU56_17195 [Capsulimonadales bacterium]|nr:hypothetical protein [Capsulimonadales bacterium]
MSLERWNEPLPPDRRERLLRSVAEAIRRRGLETPAVLALELNRPFAFIASQALIPFAPLLAPLIGIDRLQEVGRLLAEPGVTDELIARIESARPETETA